MLVGWRDFILFEIIMANDMVFVCVCVLMNIFFPCIGIIFGCILIDDDVVYFPVCFVCLCVCVCMYVCVCLCVTSLWFVRGVIHPFNNRAWIFSP